MFAHPLDIREILRGAQPHEHLCLIYKTPKEWRASVIPFLCEGLKQGHKCLYFWQAHSPDQIRAHLAQVGIDAAAAEAAGQLLFIYARTLYEKNGARLNHEQMLLLTQEIAAASAGDYPTLCVTSEMSWMLKTFLPAHELWAYEAKLNSEFFPAHPCTALCQYDRRKFTPVFIKEVLKTHPLLVRGDRIYHNSYYVPPGEYLDPEYGVYEVDLLIDRLVMEHIWQGQREDPADALSLTDGWPRPRAAARHLMAGELRESANRYRVLYEQANEAILILQDTRITDCNLKALQLFGCTQRDELIGKTPFDFSPLVQPCGAKSRQMAIQQIRTALSGERQYFEWQHSRLDGELFFAEVSLSPFEAQGNTMLQAIVRDITARKQAEEALKESEERYRRIVETANDGIWVIDAASRITFVNQRLAEMLGYSIAEMTGRPIFDFIDAEHKAFAEASIESNLKGIHYRQHDFKYRGKDGTAIWAIVSVTPIFDKDGSYAGALGMVTNITRRKEIEQALRDSEERFQAFMANSPVVAFIVDEKSRFLYVNKMWERRFRKTLDEVYGKTRFDLWPATAHIHRESDLAVLAADAALQFTEEVPNPDGSLGSWLVYKFPLKNTAGKRLIGGMAVDITERKRAEEELRQANEELGATNEELIAINEELLSTEEELKQQFEKLQVSEAALAATNQRLQNIIEFLPDATFVIDSDKKVIAWNRAMEDMTGVPKKEILGKGDWAYARPFYQYQRPMLIDYALDYNDNMISVYDSFKRDGPLVHGSFYVPALCGGKGAYLWGIASPLFDREGNVTGAIESLRNITEQRQLENRLKYLSLHDSLTGLHNRAYFEEEMRRMGEGRNVTAGIIICDVDGLKLVNDTLGHETGDLLLKSAAAIIKDSCRESDMVARIGGDEFAILLPRCDTDVVDQACARIQAAVATHNAVHPELPLSISVGFAGRSDLSVSMNDLFKEADNKMYREKLHHNQSARSAIVQTLMKTLEARDFVTEEHAERIQSLVTDLAAALELSERSMNDLRLLAQFHDIGKIGIPDCILFKKGPLNAEELINMRQHCEIGHRIAMLAPDLVPIADWILKHHEWWNGQGYPLGLKGEEIPLECRILSIADAYDAMTSDRPYRKAMTHAEAIGELVKYAGTQFDPCLVKKFIQMFGEPHHPALPER